MPRKRKVPTDRRTGVAVHWAELSVDDVDGPCTSPRRTMVDCMRSLPFDEALAVARLGLARGQLHPEATARTWRLTQRGPGAGQVPTGRAPGGRATPPTRSSRCCRADRARRTRPAIVEPQVVVAESRLSVRPDLVDRERRLVLEADSFAWHGSRRALRRDCRRYNRLVLRGYTVLRFTWEDVMHDPGYVRASALGSSRTTHQLQLGHPAVPALRDRGLCLSTYVSSRPG